MNKTDKIIKIMGINPTYSYSNALLLVEKEEKLLGGLLK